MVSIYYVYVYIYFVLIINFITLHLSTCKKEKNEMTK